MRKHTRILAAAMTIVEAIVIISLTGCSGKKVDYNMETENINTKAGSDISAFDDSTKWNDSFSVETSDKSVDVDISADITLPDCKSMSVVEVKNIKVGADFKKSVIGLILAIVPYIITTYLIIRKKRYITAWRL